MTKNQYKGYLILSRKRILKSFPLNINSDIKKQTEI